MCTVHVTRVNEKGNNLPYNLQVSIHVCVFTVRNANTNTIPSIILNENTTEQKSKVKNI